MSLNELFDKNGDSDDDNEDDDYKPENEVLSDNSGSESQEEDEVSDGHKRKSGKHMKTGEELEDNGKVNVNEKLTAEELKQKTDSIWEEFRKDVSKTDSKEVSDNDSTHNANESSKKTTVTKTYDFAGEVVTVTEEVANTSKAEVDKSNDKNSDNQKPIPPKGIKRTGGLGSVLNQLKKPKISTLQKSFIDWNDFKKTEGIEEELDQQNRSKDSFIERQAFLQRTDLRQFEIEKQIREKNRSQRQLSKD